MKPLVIFHASCNDGFCAAWIYWKYVNQDAEFIACQYGDPPPNVKGRNVAILDFSFKRKDLERMNEEAKSLVVLDHHKTAEKELEGLPYCIFDMNKSGARLTWEYIGQTKRPPKLLLYTEDRDLWLWKLAYSEEFNAALSSYSRTFPIWDEIHNLPQQKLIDEGHAILRYQDRLVGIMSYHATEMKIGKHKVMVANSPILQSEVGHRLAQSGDFGAVCFLVDGEKMVFSLRSMDGKQDVSEIAKQFGGGGHRNAAGFSVPIKLPDLSK